jgi:hypothetical protein
MLDRSDETSPPPPGTFEFHPLANVFPLLDDEALAVLTADIKAHGFRRNLPPVVMFEGKVSIDMAAAVRAHAKLETVKAVRRGQMSLNAAYEEVRRKDEIEPEAEPDVDHPVVEDQPPRLAARKVEALPPPKHEHEPEVEPEAPPPPEFAPSDLYALSQRGADETRAAYNKSIDREVERAPRKIRRLYAALPEHDKQAFREWVGARPVSAEAVLAQAKEMVDSQRAAVVVKYFNAILSQEEREKVRAALFPFDHEVTV